MKHRLRCRSILLFPQGNSNGQANDMVSVYLNYSDSKHAPENWHVCAQFALAISNPEDPTLYIQSRMSHSPSANSKCYPLTYGVTFNRGAPSIHTGRAGLGLYTFRGSEEAGDTGSSEGKGHHRE